MSVSSKLRPSIGGASIVTLDWRFLMKNSGLPLRKDSLFLILAYCFFCGIENYLPRKPRYFIPSSEELKPSVWDTLATRFEGTSAPSLLWSQFKLSILLLNKTETLLSKAPLFFYLDWQFLQKNSGPLVGTPSLPSLKALQPHHCFETVNDCIKQQK